jgi:aspartyl aminopeptidase
MWLDLDLSFHGRCLVKRASVEDGIHRYVSEEAIGLAKAAESRKPMGCGEEL